jgi:choline-sulfatase
MAEDRPNILFINTDQQSLDTIAALGCEHVHTPNMDRLASSGVSFTHSYSADPVCSPARAAWFTGRPPAENGVVFNRYDIVEDMPDLGQWLGARGYEVVYTGKWHVPGRNVAESFQFIPAGSGIGETHDGSVSRAAQGFLQNRPAGERPFFLTVGLLQPHDICYWLWAHMPPCGDPPYPELEGKLPPLPENFEFDAREPEELATMFRTPEGPRAYTLKWSELHWRYYLWSYYRHVEMVDAEIGRILDGLEDSPHAANTVVIFSSDHGEGMGRHRVVTKSALYDGVAKVPLILSCPGRIGAGVVEPRLASGLDLAPTICDYAGVEPLPKQRGLSLRPIVEGRDAPDWRDYVVVSSRVTGRGLRSERYKYITYAYSDVEQLFDVQTDPWETKNLAFEPEMADALASHRRMLDEWESQLEYCPAQLSPEEYGPVKPAQK